MAHETRKVYGYQQLTISSSAVALTIPAGAVYAWVRIESNDVRWLDTGSNPSASVGMPMKANEETEFDGDIYALRFIRQSADATLNVEYRG
jgi:hypothetical protein